VWDETPPALVSAQNQYFVAPDNGVLSVIYEARRKLVAAPCNTLEHYYLQPVTPRPSMDEDIFPRSPPGSQKDADASYRR